MDKAAAYQIVRLSTKLIGVTKTGERWESPTYDKYKFSQNNENDPTNPGYRFLVRVDGFKEEVQFYADGIKIPRFGKVTHAVVNGIEMDVTYEAKTYNLSAESIMADIYSGTAKIEVEHNVYGHCGRGTGYRITTDDYALTVGFENDGRHFSWGWRGAGRTYLCARVDGKYKKVCSKDAIVRDVIAGMKKYHQIMSTLMI